MPNISEKKSSEKTEPKKKTFKKVSLSKEKRQTKGIKGFIQEMGRVGTIVVTNLIEIPEDKPKVKANFTHIGGRQFLSVVSESGKVYPYIGYTLFARAVVENNLYDNVELDDTKNPDLPHMFNVALEGALNDSFERIEKRVEAKKGSSPSEAEATQEDE